ncbi:MAG: ATP synthase F1 subunit epsilon, partial [Actinobacteria bacterium]|nr:ATP synthase F1 subunit epsilon [Actinomycetota bacterium]
MSTVSEMLPEHPDDGVYRGSVADDLAMGQVELEVHVVSPERAIYEGQAHWVVAPGADGSFGVWPRHASLVAALTSGTLRMGLPGRDRVEYTVRGAFLSVKSNVVTILVDTVLTSPDQVDVPAVQAELAETIEAMSARMDEAEYVQLMDRREWC